VRVAIQIGAPDSNAQRDWKNTEQYVVECDRMGIDFCWSSEGWGEDAVTPLAYLAARTNRILLGTGIMQISARVPVMTAMTALTLAALSGDRFVLGLGVSGPQVVESLHGSSFERPFTRLQETLDIMRIAFEGKPIEYQGSFYKLPLNDGKALRLSQSLAPGQSIPIYLAALGERTLELTGARADGWLGTCFVPEAASIYFDPIRRGATATGRRFEDIDLQAGGPIAIGDETSSSLSSVKRTIAFRVGAMGSRDQNFYAQTFARAGFQDQTSEIQDLWAKGDREAATNAVTDKMARSSSFVGSEETVRERLRAFQRAGVTTVWAEPEGDSLDVRLEALARFLVLVQQVDVEFSISKAIETRQ
jgi:F420-dependent oxidoreductase-like protein